MTSNTVNIWSDGMGEWGNPIIPKILSFAFPRHDIITDYNEKPDLVIQSHFLDVQNCPEYDCPYITWSGESFDVQLYKDYLPLFNINGHYSDRVDSFYLPYMVYGLLDKENITPDIREYSPTTDRKYWLAYVNSKFIKIRDDMFFEIYKKNPEMCHGLGKCMNTFGGNTLSGDWSENHNTIKDYLFSISMENTIKRGYITEKIIKSFQAGCIPIYWGDSIVNEFFNSNAFININKYQSLSYVSEFVENIIKDPHKLHKYQTECVFKNNIVPDYFLWNSSVPRQWMKPMINILRNELTVD